MDRYDDDLDIVTGIKYFKGICRCIFINFSNCFLNHDDGQGKMFYPTASGFPSSLCLSFVIAMNLCREKRRLQSFCHSESTTLRLYIYIPSS